MGLYGCTCSPLRGTKQKEGHIAVASRKARPQNPECRRVRDIFWEVRVPAMTALGDNRWAPERPRFRVAESARRAPCGALSRLAMSPTGMDWRCLGYACIRPSRLQVLSALARTPTGGLRDFASLSTARSNRGCVFGKHVHSGRTSFNRILSFAK